MNVTTPAFGDLRLTCEARLTVNVQPILLAVVENVSACVFKRLMSSQAYRRRGRQLRSARRVSRRCYNPRNPEIRKLTLPCRP
jgi:hypothetical protein